MAYKIIIEKNQVPIGADDRPRVVFKHVLPPIGRDDDPGRPLLEEVLTLFGLVRHDVNKLGSETAMFFTSSDFDERIKKCGLPELKTLLDMFHQVAYDSILFTVVQSNS